MPGYLRQSTASQTVTIGPFLDDTDFKTAETALTIANTDVKLMANGAASANKNSGGGTHRVNGEYSFTFDATDSATVGQLKVSIVVAGALPVWDTFVVLEEAVYDALFAASATGIPTPTENADALLNRDMSSGTDTNTRSPRNALRFLRNKWDLAAGTLTVTKEDDSTTAWTAAVSTDAAAEPIIGSDPA